MNYIDLVPEGTKFDYENIDAKLYLALRACMPALGDVAEREQAILALAEFEMSLGPIPNWAIGRNFAYELVAGAQLCTKDGRRVGNAHVIARYGVGPVLEEIMVYDCITDAGSMISKLTESEVLDMFHIGDWISDPAEVLARFDRNNEFNHQPTGE